MPSKPSKPQDSPAQRGPAFPHVCVVEASAGSGKTYALAKRFIQLLINPSLGPEEIPLKNILAITFTNKATAQMKARILGLLKKIALDKFSRIDEKEHITAFLGVDFAEAQKKALRITDELISNYNFFQVQTIHSFINAILSTCALRLGLSATFEIRKDAARYLEYSLDSLIDAAATDREVRGAFHCFLRQYLYLENRTGWFPKDNILEVVGGLFDKMNQYGGDFVPSGIDPGSLSDGKRNIISLMRQLKEDWPIGVHKSFEKAFDEFLRGHKDDFDYKELSGYLARQDIPLTKAGKISPRAEKLWAQIRAQFALMAEAESAVLIDPYLAIFSRVMSYFRARAEKDDVLFLDELNRQARFLFDEGGMTVPELYYRLAMRLKHILIDEFQDTSPLEWENLYPMANEALSTDGSLFYVGDKKQAIYRFKGGDATLSDAVKSGFQGINLVTEALNRNYRSRGEIVAFVNDVFSKNNLRLFLERCREAKKNAFELTPTDEDAVLKVFEGAEQELAEDSQGGYVRLQVFEGENKEDRSACIRQGLLELTKELSGRYRYADIALLVRKNDDAELVTEWLVEAGIPVESEKSLNIRNNALIKELVSFLKFLNSPIDNLSFVSFILGDIFLSASGLDRQGMHDLIFSLRDKQDKEKAVYFYREFRRRFPQVWEDFFEEFFKNVGFVPLYELTVSILRRFNCPASFPEGQGFFMRFLELIKEQEQEKNSLSLFLEFFSEAKGEELYCRVLGVDAVKVLTIHKAKGLEFDAVVLPFMEMSVEAGKMAASFERGHTVLRSLHKKYRDFSGRLDDIYRHEYVKSFIDELNAIYVALTRAKEELHIFLPQGVKRNSYAARLFACGSRIDRGSIPEGTRGKCAAGMRSEVELPPSSYVDWVKFLGQSLKGEFGESRLLRNKDKLFFGEALHYFLSCVGTLSLKEKDAVLKEAFQRAQDKFPGILNMEDCARILERFSSDKRFSPFFLSGASQAFNEAEVVDKSGNVKRIDRLVVAEDKVYVLDYKASFEKDTRGTEQVREYVSLIQEIYPHLPVEGFLIYLDDLTLERV